MHRNSRVCSSCGSSRAGKCLVGAATKHRLLEPAIHWRGTSTIVFDCRFFALHLQNLNSASQITELRQASVLHALPPAALLHALPPAAQVGDTLRARPHLPAEKLVHTAGIFGGLALRRWQEALFGGQLQTHRQVGWNRIRLAILGVSFCSQI